MLNIVTVQVGNYCGRGAEYVKRLFESVEAHIGHIPYRSFCLTDDPEYLPMSGWLEPDAGITGWWNKLSLFKPGLFEGQVLYFDLDQLIFGSIEDLANYRGKFAALRDPYLHPHMNSAIMSWQGGALDHVWTTWNRGGRPQFDPRGDQRWIETMQPECDYWQDMFPGQLLSYKADVLASGHAGARIVYFHGKPKPHEMGWKLP